jgi:hypothetical protein
MRRCRGPTRRQQMPLRSAPIFADAAIGQLISTDEQPTIHARTSHHICRKYQVNAQANALLGFTIRLAVPSVDRGPVDLEFPTIFGRNSPYIEWLPTPLRIAVAFSANCRHGAALGERMAFPWELNLERPYRDTNRRLQEEPTRRESTDSGFSTEKRDGTSARAGRTD